LHLIFAPKRPFRFKALSFVRKSCRPCGKSRQPDSIAACATLESDMLPNHAHPGGGINSRVHDRGRRTARAKNPRGRPTARQGNHPASAARQPRPPTRRQPRPRRGTNSIPGGRGRRRLKTDLQIPTSRRRFAQKAAAPGKSSLNSARLKDAAGETGPTANVPL
jgi:hypothetical protein